MISLILEQPLNITSVPFFLTWAHNLVQWLLLDKHHSPQEYQSQSSVSTLSIVVHITGKSLRPELISLLAGMYTKAGKYLVYIFKKKNTYFIGKNRFGLKFLSNRD